MGVFYNKWIISEGDGNTPVPDAMVKLPHRWTGTEINGQKLSTDDYASYRIKLTGISGSQRIKVYLNNFIGAYRCYINGQLNTTYGNVSKDKKECTSFGSHTLEEWFEIKDNEPIEVVIELSASREGGLHASSWLQFNDDQHYLYWKVRNIGIFMGGILTCLTIMVIVVNLAMRRQDKNFSFSFLMLFMFGLYFFSADFYWLVCNYWRHIDFNVAQEMSYAFGVLLFGCFTVHLSACKIIRLSKKSAIIGITANIILTVCYYLLVGSPYRIIPILCQLGTVCTLFYPLSEAIARKNKNALVYSLLLTICIVFCAGLAMDYLDTIVFGLEAGFGYGMIGIATVVATLYFLKLKKTSEQAILAIKLEQQNKGIKAEALKAQIKPQFVFNSLTCIQNLYNKNIDSGNKALTAFSRHLRTNIDAEINELVPFDKELENILNYCNLENLRRGEEYNLMFDCDTYDFTVPVLSLQPYVENAIKYSKIEQKDDGYILIVSREEADGILIEISDNGIGFDLSKVRDRAQGLRNATERLKLMVNATVNIDSAVGVGTVISIRIPIKGKKREE